MGRRWITTCLAKCVSVQLVLWNFRFDWELLFWNDTLPTPACLDVYLNLQGSTVCALSTYRKVELAASDRAEA